jgi:hypothetical protein
LVYADDVNIMVGSVHTIKKNTEALLVASKEIGLEVNVDKTNYTVSLLGQNAGRSHSIKKLRADCSQGMLALIRCRIFCLPVCYPKT